MYLQYLGILPKREWINYLIDNGVPDSIKSLDRKHLLTYLVEEVEKYISTGKIGISIDYITLGLSLDKRSFMSRLKRNGLLRHSKYLTIRNPISGIAQHLLKYQKYFDLTPQEVKYSTSLLNMEVLYKDIKNIHKKIDTELLAHKAGKVVIISEFTGRASVVKTLLALNDLSFLKIEEEKRQFFEDPTEIDLTSEQKSDAISYLVSRADELYRIKDQDLLMIDEGLIKSGKADQLIDLASQFKKLREIEVKVESLDYMAILKEKKLLIQHQDIETQKSIDLSSIISQSQKDITKIKIYKEYKDTPSLVILSEKIHKDFPQFLSYREEPYPRYRFEFPAPVISLICTEPVGYYIEELEGLEYIHNEVGISFKETYKFEIAENLNMDDFFRLNRVFVILHLLYPSQLKKLINESNKFIILNSLLAIFSDEQIIDILSFAASTEKVKKYLEVMTWVAGEGKYLDLQYTPIVKSLRINLISLSVLFYSRLPRNIFPSMTKQGKNIKNKQTHILNTTIKDLVDAFLKHDFLCFSDFKINLPGVGQKSGDIDFMAYKNSFLLICECKDVIDSVDPFEYRTIDDYLIKAASQLEYIKSVMSNPEYNENLSKRLGFDLSKVAGIQYAIVPSARQLFGHHKIGYPVRNIHEIVGFLETGTYKLKAPESNQYDFKLWKDKQQITTEDLLRFFSNDSHHRLLLQSMIEYFKPITPRILERGFALDLGNLIELFKNTYPFEEVPTDRD